MQLNSTDTPIRGEPELCRRFLGAFDDPVHEPFELPGTNGGAVVLVHGFPSSPKEMRCLASLLNGRGWTTDALLLPGFGIL